MENVLYENFKSVYSGYWCLNFIIISLGISSLMCYWGCYSS